MKDKRRGGGGGWMWRREKKDNRVCGGFSHEGGRCSLLRHVRGEHAKVVYIKERKKKGVRAQRGGRGGEGGKDGTEIVSTICDLPTVGEGGGGRRRRRRRGGDADGCPHVPSARGKGCDAVKRRESYWGLSISVDRKRKGEGEGKGEGGCVKREGEGEELCSQRM